MLHLIHLVADKIMIWTLQPPFCSYNEHVKNTGSRLLEQPLGISIPLISFYVIEGNNRKKKLAATS